MWLCRDTVRLLSMHSPHFPKPVAGSESTRGRVALAPSLSPKASTTAAGPKATACPKGVGDSLPPNPTLTWGSSRAGATGSAPGSPAPSLRRERAQLHGSPDSRQELSKAASAEPGRGEKADDGCFRSSLTEIYRFLQSRAGNKPQ